MKDPLVFYKDRKGEWRWHLKARNGRIVAESGEGYRQRQSAVDGAHVAYCLMQETFEVSL